MHPSDAPPERARRQFLDWWRPLQPAGRTTVLMHSDVDGLGAGALLTRALRAAGVDATPLVTGKGEGAWTPSVVARVAASAPSALLVADLGCRAEPVLPVPTLFVDHHRPTGVPPNAALVTGYGLDPTPTSGLLASWCAGAIADVTPLAWIAALTVLSDLASPTAFPELAQTRATTPMALLREAVTLLNAPRRSSTGDATPALALLLRARDVRELLGDEHPELALLRAARAEVAAAMNEAKKVAPRFAGPWALLRLHSPCQVHPLIAQIWRTRLPKYVVLSANFGFRPGMVSFSVRSARPDLNLLDLLAAHAPVGADELSYGGGHDQATGGSLPFTAWNAFVTGLGFGSEALA